MSLCMKLKYALQINILLLMSITERNNKLLLPKHLKIFLLYANKTTLHLKRTTVVWFFPVNFLREVFRYAQNTLY